MEGLGIQGLGFRVGSKVATTAAFLFFGRQLQGFYEGFMVFRVGGLGKFKALLFGPCCSLWQVVRDLDLQTLPDGTTRSVEFPSCKES